MKLALLVVPIVFATSVQAQVEPKGLDKDEAGLWMLVDRHEQQIRTSPRLIEDPSLRTYLQRMACDIYSPACEEVRVYPVRAPGFNAAMMPNGAMIVQSGLLLRVHDESELAAVIGHEISHFYREHSVESLRRWRKTQSAFAVASAVVSAAGAVSVNAAGSYADASRALELSQTASLMLQTAGVFATFQLIAHDRDQEQEADLDGIRWLHEANYDKFAAPRVWDRLIREQEAGGNEAGFSLLSTHPAPSARMEYLDEAAKTLPHIDPPSFDGEIFAVIDGFRKEWMTDELMALSPEQFSAVCEDQIDLGLDAGYARYLEAESWIKEAKIVRGRKHREALESAHDAYGKALADGDRLPPVAFREWARVNLQLGESASAVSNFRVYLEQSPEAWDRKFIEKEIQTIEASL